MENRWYYCLYCYSDSGTHQVVFLFIGVDIKGWWQPTDADVPLKTWITERRGEEYLRQVFVPVQVDSCVRSFAIKLETE
jgi:hypothetical protein